jgi:hypothetical protein
MQDYGRLEDVGKFIVALYSLCYQNWCKNRAFIFAALSFLTRDLIKYIETRRRYSDFESFRNGLVKLYPTIIIPPIPSKQSIGEYAVKQGKAKEDATMISRRKRMLQVFLNRIAKHPLLGKEYVFHRFLDRDASWVSSSPLSAKHSAEIIITVGSPALPSPLPTPEKHSQSTAAQSFG